jgi:hypothetical protein
LAFLGGDGDKANRLPEGRNSLAIGELTGQNCIDRGGIAQREGAERRSRAGFLPVIGQCRGSSRRSKAVSASSSREPENTANIVARAPGVDPYHNPSYPKRTHFHEREGLETELGEVQMRLDVVREKLDTFRTHPHYESFLRLYHQLAGARDQIAECAQRLPLEAGELYDLDKERYHQALAAMERLWQRWERACG